MTGPKNLAELKKIRDPAERALAAKAYVADRQEAIREANAVRDEAIVGLLTAGQGVTATARACGVSVSHVKIVRLAKKAST